MTKLVSDGNLTQEYFSEKIFADIDVYPEECGIPHPSREFNTCCLDVGHDRDEPHEDADGNRWYGSPV